MTPVSVFFSAQIPIADFQRPLCQQLHVGPKLGKAQRAAPSGVPFFDVSPFGQEGDWSALTYTGKGRFSMVQAVTYQSDKQSVYFQGKLIVLENLTPVLSPEEKKKRKREIENNLYDIFSKYGDRFR